MADTTGQAAAPKGVSVVHHYLAYAMVCAAIVGGLWLHAKILAGHQVAQIEQKAAPVIQQSQATIQKAQADQSAVASQLASQLAEIAKEKQQPVEPVDYARINDMIASQLLVKSSQVTTATDPTTKQAETTVPTLQLKDYGLTCQEDVDKLNACSKSAADLEAQVTALKTETTALQTEEKQVAQVARGGSFWHKFGVGAKHALCGAAGAAVGIESKSAVVGGATWGGCELVTRKW